MKKTGMALLRFACLLALACLYKALKAVDSLLGSTVAAKGKNDGERRLLKRSIN